MDLNHYRTNDKSSTEGVWVDVDGKTRWKIAAWGNARYQRRLSALLRSRRIPPGDPEGILEQAVRQAVAETVWLDWEGMADRGQEVEYSVETAKTYLELEPIAQMVAGYSKDITLFQDEAEEELVKN